MSDSYLKNIGTYLNVLRNKYQNGEVSALIGSGFSKNIWDEFPDWKGLLSDIIIELYESEIKTEYFCKYNVYQPDQYNKFVEEKKKEIIRCKGYLEIVSQYIANKGHREYIESYIETKIPYIKDDQLVFGVEKDGDPVRIEPILPNNLVVHKKLLKGKWNNIYTTNYDEMLEYTASKGIKQWTLIKNSSELRSIHYSNAIIKLHGSIQNGYKERSLVFDYNHHHQYIISKEDYENYPKEHEVFTLFMRLSMLTETFCLIGFSGDDPNFISWVSWVRDILVKRGDVNSGNTFDKYKIYLIQVNKEASSNAEKLFYENHRIICIPLGSEKVRKIIGASEEDEIKELLLKFFSFLYTEDNDKQLNKINDHQYVDLGLPSGTLWATCNVGASSPSDYGDYFAWGETSPKETYEWTNLKYRISGDSESNVKFSKYIPTSDYGIVDNKTKLESADDAATVNWGENWRIPTREEWIELHDNCTWSWTSEKGIKGYRISSNKITGNSIFLPAAGLYIYSSSSNVGTYGNYWSSSLGSDYSYGAFGCSFISSHVYPSNWLGRYRGRSVRPVSSSLQN